MTTRPRSMSEKNAWTIGGAGVVDANTLRRYARAGFGGKAGLGSDPALLVIDVQYRTTGTRPQPFEDAVEEFTTSCGQAAWDAVANIEKLLAAFREIGWPVLFPHVAPKTSYDSGRLSAKVPAIMGRSRPTATTLSQRSPPPTETSCCPSATPVPSSAHPSPATSSTRASTP